MAKQLNVNLAFNANTAQARAEIKTLQQDLYKIMNASSSGSMTAGMKEASAAAKELSYHLNQAYNTTTGNIDLSKLNASLQKSSTNVTELSNRLLQAGSSGQSAFIGLAQAISKADYPMFKLNSRLTEMWTTLKNTARWQLSSSMLHGFMGAVQKATSYAQDLDESLTNIRIVTGQSADKMDEFAVKANRAAKALSTTTTAYTNAALIFYQQGLDGADVEERTNITIKMAQAAGENATEVSSYLTAIWNNFNNEIESGNRSLESFGDSMAKLGAETAASSAEIAAGLEKFASIGETVGLSFDYASAAVTTIVDKTRASADTVGTALKTIFARLQGLQLGETLEDGVDLNKYSEALEIVGVKVLDLNGNMRDADDIIYDLGMKWETLSRAQQTALAQTVAGTRQYTQLMSLMNNFDSFLENVDISKNAEGTLEEQAEIFADSWEGAKKRVQAAAEGIYDSLINENLMKGYNNVLADILTGVENLIDGMGGLGGVISAVGTFALSFISHKIQPAIQGLILNIQNLFTSTQAQARQLVSEVQMKNSEQINSGKYDAEQTQQLKNANVLTEARARLTVASKQLTEQESQLYQQDIQLMEMTAKQAETIAAAVTALQNQASQMIDEVSVTEASSDANRVYNEMLKERIALTDELYDKAMKGNSTSQDFDNYVESEQAMNKLIDTKERLDLTTDELVGSIMEEMYACRGSESAMAALGDDVSTLANKSLDVSGKFAQFMNSLYIPKGATDSVESYKNSVELMYKSMPKVIKQSTEVQKALKQVYDAKDSKAFNTALNQMQKAMKGVKIGGQDLNKIVKELNPKSYKEFEAILKRLSKEEANLAKAQKELNNALVGFNPQHFITGTERIVAMASAMGQVAMMGQSISSMLSAWNNEDLTFGEKLTTTFMSLSMLIPGVISSFNSLKTMISGTALATALHDAALKKMGLTQDEITAKHLLYNAAKKGEVATDAAQAASKTLLTGLLRTEKITIDENTASLIQNKIAEEMANGASLEAAITTALSTKLTGLDAAVTDKDTAAKIANKIAADALGTSLKAMLGPIGWVIAALTALITVLTAVSKHQEETRKQAIATADTLAEKSQKLADDSRKTQTAVNDLYKQYTDAKIALDGSEESKNNLKTATDKLCEALGIEWDALDRLQGKYGEVDRVAAQAMKSRLLTTIGEEQDNFVAQGRSAILHGVSDTRTENYAYGKMHNFDIGGYQETGAFANTNEEQFMVDAINQAMLDAGFTRYDNTGGVPTGDFLVDQWGMSLHTQAEDGELELEKYIQTYEVLQQVIKDVLNDENITSEQLKKSEFYNGVVQWLADNETYYQNVIASQEQLKLYGENLAEVEASIVNMDIAQVDSWEDYESYKSDYIDSLRKTFEEYNLIPEDIQGDEEKIQEYFEGLAETYLLGYQHVDEIVTNHNIRDAIKERLSNNGNSNNEIDQFLDQAEKDGTLQVVAQVITDGSTIDSLQQSMDYIQAKANEQTITAAVEVASGALKEDGMTQDDWNTIQNSGIDWGNEEQGIIEFNQFMAMTYQAQVEYLDNLANEAREKFNNSLSDQLSNVDSELAALETKRQELASQISMAQSGTAAGFHMIDGGFDVEEAKAELASLEASIASLNSQKETLNTEIQFAVTGQDDLADLNHILTDLVINGEDGIETISNLEEVINSTGATMAEAEGFDLEEFESYKDLLEDSYPALEKNAMGLNMIAIANMRLNKGVKTLCSNWDDFNDVMTDSEASAEDLAAIMPEVNEAVQDMLNLSDEQFALLPPDFAKKHWDLINDVTNGVEGAIDELRNAAGEEILMNIDAVLNDEQLQADVLALHSQIAAFDQSQFTVGVALDPVAQADFYAACNDIINAAGMTQEQANAYFANMGYDVEFEEKPAAEQQIGEVQQYWKPPSYSAKQIPYGVGGTFSVVTMDSPGEWVSEQSTMTVAEPPAFAIKTITPNGSYGGGINQGVQSKPSKSATKPKTGGNKSGGNNSTPKKNEEKTKNIDDEKDRYRVIKNQIEDLTAAYENISGAKDKAFGAAKLKAINKEIDAQKKLTDANKKYLNQIESYLSSDKSALQGKARGLGIEATFDENGTLTNYDSLVKAAVDKYNAAVAEFNKHDTDDEGAKKAFESAQEEYDKFMEILDQYDETHDLWLEQMQTVLDDIMNEQALQLERTQYEVELKINVSEDALQYLEYMMDNIENKAYDCAEAFSYLNAMTGQYIDQQAAYTQGIYDIMGNKGISKEEVDALISGDKNVYDKLMGMLSSGGEADLSDGLSQDEIDAAYGFTADDVDTLREYVSGLIEANQNLQEVRKTVHDQILNVWDEWNEKMDDGISKLEHLQAISDSYKNIIDIVGQRNLGVSDAFMSKLEQQATTQAKDKVTATKAKRDSLQKSYENAKATYEEQLAKGILSPEEIKQWEDSLRQMEADVQAASEEFQSAWEDALTAAQEQFEASVDRIIAAYDDAAAGMMGSISELQEAFNMKSDLSSQYLADYEKIYQINKLNREIENSVDSTNNVKAKQALLELQSKINAYEEAGVEISEYQMEQLRQEYELKKAQIALEEAQSAKSEVQMTRDAEGNYSYVYTANTEDVSKAEQNYEDKLYAMQKSNAEYINDLQSNMIQLEQDYQDKVKEIMTDTSLTAEERMVKLNELNEFYDQKMKFYMSEAELWQENSSRLYEEDWSAYAAATGYKISAEEDWVDHWEETQLAVLTGFTSLAEYYANHNENVATLLTSSSEALSTWQLNIEEIMEEAGTSISGFEEDATTSLDNVAAESEKTKDSVVDMADTAVTKMGEVVTAVASWENAYSKSVQNILAQNNALITSFNQVIAGWSNYTSATGSGGDGGSGGGTGGGGNGGDSGNGGNSGDTGNTTPTDNSDKIAGVAGAIWFYSNSGWGTGSTRQSRLKEKGVTGAQAYINAHADNGDIYREWQGKESQLKKYFYGSFDTGGYTGEWGDDSGRFAMLHQKEIVLNADDTENFLKTVDMVRQISEMIDLNAMSSAGGLNSLFAATSSNLAQTLQQEVTIHAEFPNATDKDQITEAFSDLINLASQYASRKL